MPVFAYSDAATAPYAVSEQQIALPGNFRLDSGEALSQNFLRLRFEGNPDGETLLVMGGISSGSLVSAESGGWWSDIVKTGGAIDIARHFIISVDFLPNPLETAKTITTADQARALRYGLKTLGFKKLGAIIGASYGGMVALALSAAEAGFAEKYCLLCAAHRPNPTATALRGVQRRILDFACAAGQPQQGVSLARQLAMIGYRSPQEFSKRFSCRPSAPQAGTNFDVCDYLTSRGDDFAAKISPQRYITLSDSIDRHYVDPSQIFDPLYLVSFSSDQLVPPDDMKELAQNASGPVLFREVDSFYGHDAFLCEKASVEAQIGTFLTGSFK